MIPVGENVVTKATNDILADGTAGDGDAIAMVDLLLHRGDLTGDRIDNIHLGDLLCTIAQPDTAALEGRFVIGDHTAGLGGVFDGRIRDVPIHIQIVSIRIHLPWTAHGDVGGTCDGDTASAPLLLTGAGTALGGNVGIGHIGAANGTTGDQTFGVLTGQIDTATVTAVGDVLIDLTAGDLQLCVLTTGNIHTAAFTTAVRRTSDDRRIHSVFLISGLITIDVTVIDQNIFEEAVHLCLIASIFIGLRIVKDTAAMLVRRIIVYLRTVKLERDRILEICAVCDGIGGIGLESDAAAVGRGITVDLGIRIENERTVLAILDGTGRIVIDLLRNTAATTIRVVIADDAVRDRHMGLVEDARTGTVAEIIAEDTAVDGRHRGGLTNGTESAGTVFFIIQRLIGLRI